MMNVFRRWLGLGRAEPLQPAPYPDLRFAAFHSTDCGMCREHNEDAVLWLQPTDAAQLAERGSLAVIADGMGGAQGGEIASNLAIDIIGREYYSSMEPPQQALLESIRTANQTIFRRARKQKDLEGMGAACVAVLLLGGRVWAAWIGDARLYLLRSGSIYQMSEDHTLSNELVRGGRNQPDDTLVIQSRHILTRALGTRRRVPVAQFSKWFMARPADRLLLTSDGIHGVLSESEILRILSQPSPHEVPGNLIDAANERGGPDNSSALVIQCVDTTAELEPRALADASPIAGPWTESADLFSLPEEHVR